MGVLAYWLAVPLAVVGWIAIVFLVMRLCPQEVADATLYGTGEA